MPAFGLLLNLSLKVLAAFRGRARTMWSDEEKEASKAYFGRNYKPTVGDDGMDYVSDLVQDYLTSEEDTMQESILVTVKQYSTLFEACLRLLFHITVVNQTPVLLSQDLQM